MKNSNLNKDAKFFCESCGSEVPRNSRTCPTCGKFFLSVRCPKCGHTGSNDDFKHGCPNCGYAVHGSMSNISFTGSAKALTAGKHTFFSSLFTRNSSNESELPFWVYLLSIVILAVLVVCLYSCLKS